MRALRKKQSRRSKITEFQKCSNKMICPKRCSQTDGNLICSTLKDKQ
jgi:hypothetical protein